MIGNSPKSDINPALAAGLNAVFVPHGNTWILEHEEVDSAEPPRQLLVVEKFAELQSTSSPKLTLESCSRNSRSLHCARCASLRSG